MTFLLQKDPFAKMYRPEATTTNMTAYQILFLNNNHRLPRIKTLSWIKVSTLVNATSIK